MLRADRITFCRECGHRIDRSYPCPYCRSTAWQAAVAAARLAAEKAPRERGQRYRDPDQRPDQRYRGGFTPRPEQRFQPPPATEPGPPYRPRPKGGDRG